MTMSSKNPNLILDVDENPKKVGQWLILALQHVLAMFVACVTVPLIVFSGYTDAEGVSLAYSMIAPTLVSAGIGTLFYLILTRWKSPIFLASSFAYMAPMSEAIAIGKIAVTDGAGNIVSYIPNLWMLPVGMLFVGVVYCIVALVIKIYGVGWLNKLLPPVVIGPVIMVIGLSLSVSAVNNLQNTASASGSYNIIYVASGLAAMLVTALCAHYGKGTISLIPFILGIAAGYVVASLFTAIGYYGAGNEYFKVVDWSPLVNNFAPVNFNSFFSLPDFLFLQESAPITWAQVGQCALLFIPVSFVTICEHIGDHKNLSNIIGRDLTVDPGLTRTLMGDGIATAISGIFCGAANTSYGENVAVVGVTKIASTKVIGLAAVFAILLGFLSPLMSFTMTIPSCVTGGVSLILYGFIAASGVKMLIHEKVDFSNTKNIFVASVILVSGIGGLSLTFGPSASPYVTITSTAVSMLLGILMNTILRDKKAPALKKEEGKSETEKD